MNTKILAGVLGLAALAACSDDGGPAATGRVDVSFAAQSSASAVGGAVIRGVEAIDDDAGNVLLIDSGSVVLRKLHLQAATADSVECEDSALMDDCAVLREGPFLVDLLVDGTVDHMFTATVDAGTYMRAMMQIHKPTGSADVDFLAEHPGYDGVSVRVVGTFNDEPFVYTTGVTDVQHTPLDPPLTVLDGGTVALTIQVDLSTWFRGPGGILVDPTTAMGAGANVTLVHQNVIASFHGIVDADQNGLPDE